MLTAILLLSLVVQEDTRTLDLPLKKAPRDLDAVRNLEAVRAASVSGSTLTLRVDPYVRLTLSEIERAGGAVVDLDALRIRVCADIVLKVPAGGGGKAPCLESPERGCFSAAPVTAALEKVRGVKAARLADMRPGGGLAWRIIVEEGKTVSARDLVDAAVRPDGRNAFDLVLSGVFPDHISPIPSEALPKMRPGAVRSAMPLIAWEHSLDDALARAKKENKMIFLNVHHFD